MAERQGPHFDRKEFPTLPLDAPRFTDRTYSSHNYFIRTTWLLYGLGAFIAVIRILTRRILAPPLGLEDYLIFFSLLAWTADVSCIPYIVNHGTNDMDPDIRKMMIPNSPSWKRRTMASQMFIGAWAAYICMIWLLKASILVFYGKVTERAREQRVIMWMWGAVGSSWLACMLTLFLTCRPFRANWQIYPDPGKQCTDGLEYVWTVGVLNITTDAMLLAIPLPIVFRLHISPRRKIMLGGIFSFGFFVIIATALRIWFTVEGDNIPNIAFLSMIETCSAMIVANLPGLRAAVIHFQRSRAENSNSTDSFGGKDPEADTPSSTDLNLPKHSDSSSTDAIIPRREAAIEGQKSRCKGFLAGGVFMGIFSRTRKLKSFEEFSSSKIVIHKQVTYGVTARERNPEEIAELEARTDEGIGGVGLISGTHTTYIGTGMPTVP